MKEILEKLLPYYREHLSAIEQMDDLRVILDYAEEKDIDMGICHAASQVLGEHIYSNPLVKARANGSEFLRYWGPCAAFCCTKADVIAAIQTRITIMEELLSEAAKEAPHA